MSKNNIYYNSIKTIDDSAEQIRNSFLKYLGHDREYSFVCALGEKKKEFAYIKSPEKLNAFAEKWNSKAQVYISINPCKKEGAPTWVDNDHITYWSNILIDIDSIKYDSNIPEKELNKYCATEDEREKASIGRDAVLKWLKRHGFSSGYHDDTGNGFRFILPIPKQKLDSKFQRETLNRKYKAFTKLLQVELETPDCGYHIDNTFDWRRITGVPLTLNIKKETPGRPQRIRKPMNPIPERVEDQKLLDFILNLELNWIEELQKILKKDTKLCLLFHGNIAKYKSRSEAELALCQKLIFYNFSDDEIFKIMDISKIGKWQEEISKGNKQYCERTLKKAHENQKEASKVGKNKFVSKNERRKEITKAIMEKIQFITIEETDEVLYYNEGIYKPHGEVVIKKEAQQMYDAISTHMVNEIINEIRRKTYVPISKLNENKNLIVMENGVYDLKYDIFFDHNPEYFATIKIPIKFDRNANCSAISKFFRSIVNKEDIPVIEELFGYCLLKDYPIQKVFMLVGSGANGKSTLLKLLKTFLGSDAVVSISLQELERNRFAVVNLFSKLANIYADLSSKALYGTGTLKMLTGGDTITAEKKFGGFFSFVNYAKLIFSANSVPFSFDDSMAFFRRWVIIKFPNVFENKKADIRLIEKLTTKKELSGLFNLAINGLKRILNNECFTNDKSTDFIKDQYIRSSDPVQAFVMDTIDNESQDSFESGIEKPTLYNVFKDYCKLSKYPILSSKKFFSRFKDLVRVEEQRIQIDEKRVRALIGVKFTNFINKIPHTTLHAQHVQDYILLWKTIYEKKEKNDIKDNTNKKNNTNNISTKEKNAGHVGQVDPVLESKKSHVGHVEPILENGEVSSVVLQEIEDQKKRGVPVIHIEDIALNCKADKEQVRQILKGNGYKISKIGLVNLKSSKQEIELKGIPVYNIRVKEDMELLRAIASDVIYLDIETTGLDPYTCDIKLIQIYDGKQVYLIYPSRIKNHSILKSLLENKNIKKVIHNSKFEYKFILNKFGIEIKNIHDTLISEFLLSGGIRQKYDLQSITEKYKTEVKVVKHGEEWLKREFNDEIGKEALEYAVNDVLVLKELYEKQWAQIKACGLEKVYLIEHNVVPAVASIELKGMKYNVEGAKKVGKWLEERLSEIKKEIKEKIKGLWSNNGLNGEITFDIDKQKDKETLLKLMYEKGLLKELKRTDKGNITTGKEALKLYNNPITNTIVEYQSLKSLKSKEIEGNLAEVNAVTERLHTDLKPFGTHVGRFTSNNPNLQNIPRDSRFRSLFVAKENHKLVIADYSQIHLRIMADLSGDALMIQGFKDGVDMHTQTASVIFNKPIDQVTDDERSQAKGVNFGLPYGISSYGLLNYLKQSGIKDATEEQAKEYLDNMQKTYPNLMSYLDGLGTQALNHKYIIAKSGRIIKFNSKNISEYALERQGRNNAIIALEADIMKVALANIYHALKQFNGNAYLIGTVHDELLVECKESIAEEVENVVEEEMIKAGKVFLKKVPVLVETKHGRCWEK